MGAVILATGGYAADFSPTGSLLKEARPDLVHLPTVSSITFIPVFFFQFRRFVELVLTTSLSLSLSLSFGIFRPTEITVLEME